MEYFNSLVGFLSQPYMKLILSLFVSFAITFYGIPAVVSLAKAKSLYDMPNCRTSHYSPIPRLGGTMIFAGVILSSVIFTSFFTAYELKYIIAGMIILFFLGLKDDIISLTPHKKLIGQILAASVIVLAGNIRLTGLDKFIQNDFIAFAVSVFITIFLIVALINSINLIDGIDGLASGIAMIASAFFGAIFMSMGHVNYAIICISLIGSLAAFTWYNVFSEKNKIFLGDTGSTIIGFLMAVFVIRFIELTISDQYQGTIESAPAIAFAVLLFPIFDMLRIMVVRLLNKRPIFEADNNHIHHMVLKVFGTHLKSTVVILTINVILIAITYFLRGLGSFLLIIILLGISLILTSILKYYIKKNNI
ncbi:MAG: glycosyltransferase family 4 protein [Fastidiosipilaceae bacterium]|jgi:UDP-GlcNAc:undecaprenyl-phosphate GlcNAc-1-phosphate transferase